MKMYIVYGEINYGDGYESPKRSLFVTHSEDLAKGWIDRYTSITERMKGVYMDKENPRRNGISKLYDPLFCDEVFYEEIEVR